MEEITKEVASKHKVKIADLKGRAKDHATQLARRELVFRLVEQGYTPLEIGRFLSGRTRDQISRLHEIYKDQGLSRKKTGVQS